MRLPLATERVSHHGQKGYKRKRLRTRNHNVYSQEDKAKALVIMAVTENIRETERLLNIPNQTLGDWRRGRGITQEIKTMAKYFGDNLKGGAEEILGLSMDTTRANLKAGAVKQRELNEINRDWSKIYMTLEGMATERVETITPDETKARLDAIRAKLKEEDSEDGA